MKSRILIALILFAGIGLPQEGPPADADGLIKSTLRRSLDRKGVFLPADAAEIQLELKVYRGELRILEVRSHGSFVNEGDVLARLDPKEIDRQIETDRMALERAEMAMRHADENAVMAAQGWADSLARSELEATRAATRLKGYREREKAFDEESERLTIQSRKYRMEDQQDELTQLEKMYSEDELVDATEEIVLKRQRRSFARNKANNDLTERRRVHNKEYYYAWREEDLVRESKRKEQALRNQHIKNKMARESLDADLAKKRYDLEKKRENFRDLLADKEKLEIRAPRRGLLLHGAAEAAPWGSTLKKDSTLRNRQVFASVVDPEKLKVTTSLDEKMAPKVRNGAPVEVTPVAYPDKKLMGRIRVDYLPGKGGVFEAEVELAGGDVAVRPGMNAELEVILEEARDVIVAPVDKIGTREDGTRFVMVDGEERTVVAGLEVDGRIALLSGVKEGERLQAIPQK
jgi:multidrug resistance efflux pump